MITPDEAHAHAIGGKLAAIEYCRVMHTILTTLPAGQPGLAEIRALVENQLALDGIEADCGKGDLDLLGALATITVRAASLASSVVDGMTPGKFFDMLEAELTPPDGTPRP
jgi:hypothetical protein